MVMCEIFLSQYFQFLSYIWHIVNNYFFDLGIFSRRKKKLKKQDIAKIDDEDTLQR